MWCANFSCFKNCAKMQKIPKNSKILKNDGHFRISHPQISLKQFSNMYGGGKIIKDFRKAIKFCNYHTL